MPIQEHTARFFDQDGDEIEDIRLSETSVPFIELHNIAEGEYAHHVQALDAYAKIAYCAQTEPGGFLDDFQRIHEVEVFDKRVTLPEIQAAAQYDGGKYARLLTGGQQSALLHFDGDMLGSRPSAGVLEPDD